MVNRKCWIVNKRLCWLRVLWTRNYLSPFRERMALRLHLWLSRNCALHFTGQLTLLREAARHSKILLIFIWLMKRDCEFPVCSKINYADMDHKGHVANLFKVYFKYSSLLIRITYCRLCRNCWSRSFWVSNRVKCSPAPYIRLYRGGFYNCDRRHSAWDLSRPNRSQKDSQTGICPPDQTGQIISLPEPGQINQRHYEICKSI